MIPDSPTSIFVIENEADAEKAIKHILRFDMFGYDVETYHSVERHIPAFDPTDGAKMRLAQFGTPTGEAFVFDLYKVDPKFLLQMFPNRTLCVGHNLKFEMKFLMHQLGVYDFGPVFDTMIAEQIIAKGKVTGAESLGFGLDKTVKRRLKVTLPKDEQASAWYKKDLTDSQIEYAARDAIVVLPLYEVQRDLVVTQGQTRVLELEFNALEPIASMELNGVIINRDKWTAQCEKTEQEIAEVQEKLWAMLGQGGTLFNGVPTLNLNARQTVREAFERRGIKVPLDRDGKKSLDKSVLAKIQHHEEVSLYLEYSKLAKAVSSYGRAWLDLINRFDGRIHCGFRSIGAETGRMSASNPNMMQIPKSNEMRNCFEATPGWVLVDSDFSQCELRILAEYCRDPNLLKAFDNGYDLHKFTAHLVFNVPMDEVTKSQRSIAKNLNFGIVYGIGAAKFAGDAGISVDEAKRILNYYLTEAYPRMGAFLEFRAKDVMRHLSGTTMSGRIRQYGGDLSNSEFVAKVQRNAKNLPIQGTNADITKHALRLAYNKFQGKSDVRMLLAIHDEIIIECVPEKALEYQKLLNEAMIEAESDFLLRVPSVVDSDITTVWCKDPTPEHLQEAQELMDNAK